MRFAKTDELSATTRVNSNRVADTYRAYCASKHHRLLEHGSMMAYLETRTPFASSNQIYRESVEIRRLFKNRKLPDPLLDPLVAGGIEGLREKAVVIRSVPLLSQPVQRIVDAHDSSIMSIRDIAAVQLFFVPNMTAMQISNLRWQGVEFHAEGMRLHLINSRNGRGRIATVGRIRDARYCPVAALERWQRFENGPYVFYGLARGVRGKLQASAMYQILDRALRHAGVKVPYARRRSLLAALIATATDRGADLDQIREQLGFCQTDTVAAWQFRLELKHSTNLTEKLGL